MRIVRDPPRYILPLGRETVALVLAGGRGTRLQGLTRIRAKPATAFAGKYRIVDFSLSNCMNSGVRRIGVLTQYQSVQLIAHVQRAWGHFRGEMGEYVAVLPAHQRETRDHWYAGTADAIHQNLAALRTQSPRYVMVLAGDHVYSMDYYPMVQHHVDAGADVTIGAVEVPVRLAREFGVMKVGEDLKVREFIEKPRDPEAIANGKPELLASMGIYVFGYQYLIETLAADARDPESSHDFGKDVIPNVLAKDQVFAYPFRNPDTGAPGYWRDVGTIDSFFHAHMDLLQPVPDLNLYDEHWPIWTSVEHLPPAKLSPDAMGRPGTAERSMLSSGSIISGADVHGSVLSYDVKVDRARISDSICLPGVKVGEGCRLHRAIIDEDVVLPPGTVIGEDADADRERFLMTDNGVVLVTQDATEPVEESF